MLASGFLYGTTFEGVSNSNARGGAVFKITTAGMLTTLHSFHINNTDGFYLLAGLLLSNGNFYGTTYYEGA